MELMNKHIITPTVALSGNCANIEEQLYQIARNYEYSTTSGSNCANINAKSTSNTKPNVHNTDPTVLTKTQRLALLTKFINRITAPDYDMTGEYNQEDDQMGTSVSVPVGSELKETHINSSSNSTNHHATTGIANIVIDSSNIPEEMYWLGSQEQEWHSSGSSSGLSATDSTRMDETDAPADIPTGSNRDTRATIPTGINKEDMIIPTSGTASSFHLNEEQYLYVVAALCEVRFTVIQEMCFLVLL